MPPRAEQPTAHRLSPLAQPAWSPTPPTSATTAIGRNTAAKAAGWEPVASVVVWVTAPPPPPSEPPRSTSSAYPNPGRVTGSVVTHDPTMIRTPSGQYRLYATGGGISSKASTDRTAFAAGADAFGSRPGWWSRYSSVPEAWAPDISYHGGTYLMYYSVSSFGSNTSTIGARGLHHRSAGQLERPRHRLHLGLRRRLQRHRPEPLRRRRRQVVALLRQLVDRHQDDPDRPRPPASSTPPTPPAAPSPPARPGPRPSRPRTSSSGTGTTTSSPRTTPAAPAPAPPTRSRSAGRRASPGPTGTATASR
ncbi:hypothetical protein STENM327S_08373 [Streptomyces tendae]